MKLPRQALTMVRIANGQLRRQRPHDDARAKHLYDDCKLAI